MYCLFCGDVFVSAGGSNSIQTRPLRAPGGLLAAAPAAAEDVRGTTHVVGLGPDGTAWHRAFPAGVVVCTGMVIFDGINLPPRTWGPLSFVPYLSINRWAIENLYLGVVDNYAHKYDLRPVLDEYEFVQGRQATAYAAIAALGLFWRLVAFGCLLAQRRTKR